jgi:hypothetical protein
LFGVTHPPKSAQGNALRQFAGSYAFVAAPRLAFFVTRDPDGDRNLLLPVKNNIGKKAPGLGYTIAAKVVSHGEEAPFIMWDSAPVRVTADEAIAANAANASGGEAKAIDFLEEMLADGPVESSKIWEEADKRHISNRQLKKAKEKLEVKASKDAFKGGWVWSKGTAKGTVLIKSGLLREC